MQNRKVKEVLGNHGIHPYDAVIGMPYNPALHERVSSRRVEGMDALRVAEQTAARLCQPAAGICAAPAQGGRHRLTLCPSLTLPSLLSVADASES